MQQSIWEYLRGIPLQTEPPITAHGSAMFMDKKREGHLLSKFFHKGFVIDGRRRLPTSLSNTHCAVVAPTGAGKSSSIILPNLLYGAKSKSILTTDPSGELHKLSARLLKARGYQVLKYDLSLQKKVRDNLSYNPLALIRNDSDIRKLARILIEAGGISSSESSFWDKAAQELISLCIKALLLQPESKRNLFGLYQLLNLVSAEPEQLEAIMRLLGDTDWYRYLSYKNYSEKVRTSILATARTALSIFSDERIQSLTNTNTLDLSLLRKKKVAIFIVAPERDIPDIQFVLTILFGQLFELLLDMPKRKEKSILLFLDEMSNIGKIPSVDLALTTLRKRRVGVLICLQDIKQLYAVYGRNLGDIILNNCLSKVILPGTSLETADKVSSLLGQATVSYTSPLDEGASPRYVGRMLQTADEVRRMDADTGFFIYGNERPVQLSMRPWYKNLWLRFLLFFFHS